VTESEVKVEAESVIVFTLDFDTSRMSAPEIKATIDAFKETSDAYQRCLDMGCYVLVMTSGISLQVIPKLEAGDVMVVGLDDGKLNLPPARWAEFVESCGNSMKQIFPDNRVVIKTTKTEFSVEPGDTDYDGDSYW
jgi:hypothetical protein